MMTTDDPRRRLHRALGIMLRTTPEAAQRIEAFAVWRTLDRDHDLYPEAYDPRRKGNLLRKQRLSLGQDAARARQQGNTERAAELDSARGLLARAKATVKADLADLTSARDIELLGIRETLKVFHQAAEEGAITVSEVAPWLDDKNLPPASRWTARCGASIHRLRGIVPSPSDKLDNIDTPRRDFNPLPPAKLEELRELLCGFREDLQDAMAVPAVTGAETDHRPEGEPSRQPEEEPRQIDPGADCQCAEVRVGAKKYSFRGHAQNIVRLLFEAALKGDQGLLISEIGTTIGSEASRFRIESAFRLGRGSQCNPGFKALIEKLDGGRARLRPDVARTWRAESPSAHQ